MIYMDGQCQKKLPVDSLNASQFNKGFMENCNLYTGEGHFLETDIQYLKNLHDCHKDFLFLAEKMKIERIYLTFR